MSKPYTAKSLAGAQRRVRELTRMHADTTELLDQYARDRLMLAKLASRAPMFFNPLDVMEAEQTRDKILKAKGLLP